MADPISLFPEFVRNQVYPPIPTSTVVVQGPLEVSFDEENIVAAVDEDVIIVTVDPEELEAGV
jgi:hypothetical protein